MDDAPEEPQSQAAPTQDEATRKSLPGVQVRRTGSRPRRLIAVAGAKGGAGKTVIASNLGVYLASLGRSVVVVDADVAGAHLHTALGVPPMMGESLEDVHPASEPPVVRETPTPGLYFIEGGVSDLPAGLDRPRTRRELFGALDRLDADYVVLDLGSGLETALLDAFLGADVAVYVTVPEPAAVESTYRFVRALYLRRLRQTPETEAEREELDALARELGGLPNPRDLVMRMEEDPNPLYEPARALLDSFDMHIVVNQARVRADLELGEAMATVSHQRLGVRLSYLGYVDFDDTVWTCVREGQPLLVRSPSTKSSKNLEKIARRLLAIDAGKAPPRPRLGVPRGTHHDLLEVERGATDEEVRRAYRRARDVYATGSLPCYGLFAPGELGELRARLEEAYDVLLDPARRRPYELSVFPHEPETEREIDESATQDEARPPAPTITPETEFDGALLRTVRESQGIPLRQISRRTKIGMPYLQAIEDDDFGALPAVVYVRGFVREVAKCLGLDPAQVSHSYVRRMQRSKGTPA